MKKIILLKRPQCERGGGGGGVIFFKYTSVFFGM